MLKYFNDIYKRRFVCFYHFNSWLHFSLGFHIDFASPNIEIHIPTGFIRIGWQGFYKGYVTSHSFGKRLKK